MKSFKNFFKERNKVEINIPISLGIIFFVSTLITLFIFMVSPGSFRIFLRMSRRDILMPILNYLPILLSMISVYFIFNNVFLGISIPSFIFVGMAIVNRTKVELRQDPFQPVDLTLVNEAVSILKNFDPIYLLSAILLVFLIFICIFISIKFFKGKKINKYIRVILPITFIIVTGFIFNSVYKNQRLYNRFEVNGNIYFIANQYESKGFIYSFIHDLTKQTIVKPENYSANTYKEIESNYKYSSNKDVTKPHIVMIMGEAFSDISESAVIDFNGYTDPLENYKSIASSPNSISGSIITPSFGGGTANTEFDVLTGGVTTYLNNSLSSYNFIVKDTPALPSMLKNMGYDTLAIHPSFGWFYNRQNVYDFFGFDKTMFGEHFDLQTQRKGEYISEEVTMDAIIDTFDHHLRNSDTPLFSFTVTIQNHGPYDSKYGITKNFNTSVPLANEEYNILSNYFEGVHDADVQIKRLVDHFNNVDEPVVLVYFGDHLPGFTNGMTYYDKLMPHIDVNGTLEQGLNQYRTPFLIWENNSAKKLIDFEKEKNKLMLSEDPVISANYLGAMLTELLEFKNISPIFDFENELRKKLPVFKNGAFIDESGEYTSEISYELLKKLEFLQGWVYYQIKDR